MSQAAAYDVMWLASGDERMGQRSPIRVWRRIQFVHVGEAYRVSLTDIGLNVETNAAKTTVIKAPKGQASSILLTGCYELTAVYTDGTGGEAVHVMRRIS